MTQQVHTFLTETEIESLFKWIIDALRVTIVLDSVDMLPDKSGCLIRSHDEYGPLPDIKIAFENDKNQVLDLVSLNTARLGMVVRFRKEIAAMLPQCTFWGPISKRKTTLVGIDSEGETIMGKGPDLCRAYQELKLIVANASLQLA